VNSLAELLPTSLEKLTLNSESVVRLALAVAQPSWLWGQRASCPLLQPQSRGYCDFCGDALAVAAGEGAALCCGVTPVPRSEAFAVEGETFALALGAGVLPGKPAAGATVAAGVAAGIPISSRCKLLSLALRRA